MPEGPVLLSASVSSQFANSSVETMARSRAFINSFSRGSTILHWRPFSSNKEENYFSSLQDEDEGIQYPYPQTRIGELAPHFRGPAVIDGEITTIDLTQYNGKWVVLFFYPKDFTFVCPTEIIAFSDRVNEFEALNTQLIACSTDTEECHLAWTRYIDILK